MTGCDGGEHGRAGFGAKGLRLIIVVVQLGVAVKIYEVAVEALRKKESDRRSRVPTDGRTDIFEFP
jgi:hypothetical protein